MIHKKDSGLPTVSKTEAVEEALCFGWIDSQIRRFNETSYLQRFSPRRPGINGSNRNKGIIARLIEGGRMAEPGLTVIRQAQKDGSWDKADNFPNTGTMNPDFR